MSCPGARIATMSLKATSNLYPPISLHVVPTVAHIKCEGTMHEHGRLSCAYMLMNPCGNNVYSLCFSMFWRCWDLGPVNFHNNDYRHERGVREAPEAHEHMAHAGNQFYSKSVFYYMLFIFLFQKQASYRHCGFGNYVDCGQ